MADDRSRDEQHASTEREQATGSDWDQVGRQDQASWVNRDKDEGEEGEPLSAAADQDRSISYGRSPAGGSQLPDAPSEDDGRQSKWDQDDYRRTEFAGSRDETSHPEPSGSESNHG